MKLTLNSSPTTPNPTPQPLLTYYKPMFMHVLQNIQKAFILLSIKSIISYMKLGGHVTPTPAHTFTKQTNTILGVGWACKIIIIMLDLTFSADAMFISKNLLSNRNSADPQNIIKYSPAHFFSFNGGLYLNRSSALCSGVFMQVCKVSLMI